MRMLAGLACLLTALLLRDWLEAAMLRHMLLQLPLLITAGWLLALRWPAVNLDPYGLCGLTATLFVTAYWMIPRALEQSINLPAAEVAKFASLLAVGAILPDTLRRANWIVQAFYLGNLSWMMGVAGIEYQNMPQRLCNAYLLDDQIRTGMALVAVSVAVAVLWGWRLARPALRQ